MYQVGTGHLRPLKGLHLLRLSPVPQRICDPVNHFLVPKASAKNILTSLETQGLSSLVFSDFAKMDTSMIFENGVDTLIDIFNAQTCVGRDPGCPKEHKHPPLRLPWPPNAQGHRDFADFCFV